MYYTADIEGSLTPAEAEEHRKLTQLLELARSAQPLTLEQIADLCGCSPSLIRYHESNALKKLQLLHPELKEFLPPTN